MPTGAGLRFAWARPAAFGDATAGRRGWWGWLGGVQPYHRPQAGEHGGFSLLRPSQRRPTTVPASQMGGECKMQGTESNVRSRRSQLDAVTGNKRDGAGLCLKDQPRKHSGLVLRTQQRSGDGIRCARAARGQGIVPRDALAVFQSAPRLGAGATVRNKVPDTLLRHADHFRFKHQKTTVPKPTDAQIEGSGTPTICPRSWPSGWP